MRTLPANPQYATAAEYRAARGLSGTTDELSDEQLNADLQAASEEIQTRCNRDFTSPGVAETRTYTALRDGSVSVDDCHTVTAVMVGSESLDDFRLDRGVVVAVRGSFLRGARIEVTATFGFAQTPAAIKAAVIRTAAAMRSATPASGDQAVEGSRTPQMKRTDAAVNVWIRYD